MKISIKMYALLQMTDHQEREAMKILREKAAKLRPTDYELTSAGRAAEGKMSLQLPACAGIIMVRQPARRGG